MSGLKSSKKVFNHRWTRLTSGLAALILVLILNLFFHLLPGLYDLVYFKTIFQLIRFIHDYTLGLLPVPSAYIVIPFMLFYFFSGSFVSLKKISASFLALLLWALSLFYFLWGFNYHRENLRDTLGLHTNVDSTYIIRAFEAQTVKLGLMAYSVKSVDGQNGMESSIRELQESLLSKWGIPTIGRVRVRKLIPGSLLHFRTTGIYIPHAVEGHIDAGMYEVQHAFTLAHEMAHGYGITDESECNFIAYITCINSNDKIIRFSAELAYWRYLAGYYARLKPESWRKTYETLDPEIKYHLSKIREHVERFKELMPKYRDRIYDRYLKSHGVSSGINSYDEMIVLIKAYNEKNPG